MEILEFRKIRRSDIVDLKYNNWSRIYEYPLVLSIIKRHTISKNTKIHNTSWGWEGCHIQFKTDLDLLSDNCIHTDRSPSNLPKTDIWDITHEPKDVWLNSFDIVINISTVEEVNFNHITIFENLLKLVKDGGLLIITFDLPGLQLDKFEKKLKYKIKRFNDEISGINSEIISKRDEKLTCGILILRK